MTRYRRQAGLRFLLCTVFFVVGQRCEAAQETRRIGDFYVSWKGDDVNPGTRALPFATLQRARDQVRKRIKDGLTKDIVVLIQEGTYYLPYGIAFGPEDSGTDKHRITYAAYGQDVPVLTGGVKLNDWQKHQGHIYVTDFPMGFKGTQLFEDAVWMPWARAPKEGYFKLDEPAQADGKTAFTYRSEDMNPDRWDISDAQVNLWPYHDWFNHTYSLAAVDGQKKMLVLDTSGVRLLTGNRFYVRNILQLLETPGHCCVSRRQGKIYVWPRSGNIRQARIILSTAKNAVRIQGTNGQPVKNLHLEGLDIGICEEHAIDISNAQNCSIQYCTVENSGQTGVMIHGNAQQIRIYGNRIRYHGQHGVSLEGRGSTRDQINHHNTIENNHIHHCGRLIGHGYGVHISQSGYNQILYNHIHHMPRYGVSLKGARYKTIEGKVEGMTWENRYDFMPGRNNRIACNDIHHTNLDSQDTGAIESWGSGRDNTIDHNLIHDTGNRQFNLQSGIYLDDQADYWTVTNNIIYGVIGTDYNQCIYAKGIGNHIENNILVGSSISDVGIRSFFMADERCDHHRYLRNIFYFEPASREGVEKKDKAFAYGFVNWSQDRIADCDFNLFYCPDGRVSVKGSPADGSMDQWKRLYDGKFDAHSIEADPGFKDISSRDFSLASDSPALKLGFKPIDISQIGLQEDFPARFERE